MTEDRNKEISTEEIRSSRREVTEGDDIERQRRRYGVRSVGVQ